MKIPKELKIGARIVKIEIDNRTGDDGYNGTAYIDKGIINLKEDAPQEKKEITLLHEILHNIFHQCGWENALFEKKSDSEEWLCTTLSYHLYQVLEDNDLLK